MELLANTLSLPGYVSDTMALAAVALIGYLFGHRTRRPSADPVDEKLAAQAVTVRWSLNSKGAIAIESKDKMKSRGEKSPDNFEAQVYSFADDVLRPKGRSKGRPDATVMDVGLGIDTPFAGLG